MRSQVKSFQSRAVAFWEGPKEVGRGTEKAEIHYKIRMTQSELAVLQRELNEALLIYDPNPQKALRENVTRNNINAHRKAVEDKKKELAELRRQLSDLEDASRHAGGDPGWSRE